MGWSATGDDSCSAGGPQRVARPCLRRCAQVPAPSARTGRRSLPPQCTRGRRVRAIPWLMCWIGLGDTTFVTTTPRAARMPRRTPGRRKLGRSPTWTISSRRSCGSARPTGRLRTPRCLGRQSVQSTSQGGSYIPKVRFRRRQCRLRLWAAAITGATPEREWSREAVVASRLGRSAVVETSSKRRRRSGTSGSGRAGRSAVSWCTTRASRQERTSSCGVAAATTSSSPGSTRVAKPRGLVLGPATDLCQSTAGRISWGCQPTKCAKGSLRPRCWCSWALWGNSRQRCG
mmetsp:Transcript_144129/g.401574  ORF Transcript_144129/g.401574 Transcript_144129/m.401574 type:complete len:288 (-) Transcript_144129:473-1336(-)